MDWIAHYNKITVSPEEAVRIVDSGDRVYLDPSVNSFIPNALAARSAELSDVRVMFQGPFEYQDWLGGGYQRQLQSGRTFLSWGLLPSRP